VKQIILDDQFTEDFTRSFDPALTNTIWIVVGAGLFYGAGLVWTHQWILGVLGVLSMSIIPVAWYAKRAIRRGRARTSLVMFAAAILLILGSALVLVRGLDAAIIAGFSIPIVAITLTRARQYSALITIVAGLLAGIPLLTPVLPWQPIILSPMVGSILTLAMTLATLSVLGLASWHIMGILQQALNQAHMHLAAHRAVESALRESEARFRSAFDYAPIGMALIDLEGRWLQANQAIYNLFGYSQTELFATTLQSITHPDDQHTDGTYTGQILSGVIPTYQTEKRYIHATGRIVWTLVSVSLVHDAQERPHYFIFQIQDITARKQTESELAQSHANNSALLQALPDTLYRVGVDGIVRDYKAGHVDYLAIPSENYLGKGLSDFLPPAVADQIKHAIANVIETGQLQLIEQQVVLSDEPRDYEFRVVGSGVDEALTLARDITERKTSERLKDEFVAVVSHELRTPLTAIRGALGLLAGAVVGTLPPQAQTMVKIALSNSERLLRLINDLLDIQKIEAGKLTVERAPLALLPLLQHVITSNMAYAQQFNVTIRLECDSEHMIVDSDPDRLMQILTNLLSNAAKFSPSGDTVVMRVSRHEQLIRIAVIDHGPGIPEAFHSQVFQKFAQADGSATRRTGGTGLGLSIAKAMVESLGGQIGFETRVGMGTTFVVDLPLWRGEVDAGEVSEPAISR
jgi:PAS domain S-box-containing protein